MRAPTMRFEPEWKERLNCTCSLGGFVLDMPMGVVSVCFPTLENWNKHAPEWAKPHYDAIQDQLRTWCADQGIPLSVDRLSWAY